MPDTDNAEIQGCLAVRDSPKTFLEFDQNLEVRFAKIKAQILTC